MNKTSELRKEILEILKPQCVRCGFVDDSRALQVDHVQGDGWLERSELRGVKYWQHIRENLDSGKYQILCANCNVIKMFDEDLPRHNNLLRRIRKQMYVPRVHPEESMELQIAKTILERLPATMAELLYWLSPKFNSAVVKRGLVFLCETRQIKYQGKYLVRDLGSIRAEHSGTSQLVDSTSESVKG